MTASLRINIFKELLRSLDIPLPETEHKFHPTRKWRFDYAWPRYKIALEVEGGVWTGGRHTRPKGFLGDVEKYNHAAAMGWRILRTTPGNLIKAETAQLIKQSINQ
jgi:hypothetical protein